MSYLQLNEQNFQEYLFDINNNLLYEKGSYKEAHQSNYKGNISGFFNSMIEKKGHILVMQEKFLFKHNIILNNANIEDGIMLFYVKKGGNLSIHKKTGQQVNYYSNTNGMYFINNHSNYEQDAFLKDNEHDVTMFFIPIFYYEQLVNLYPNLFEQSFIRYQKGESFFLSKNFAQTTATHYNILSQIENSHLMGNCSNAYVDAKILELLSMYFYYLNGDNAIKNNEFANYDKIKEAEFILKSQLNNPPSVKDLALQVGVNPNILQSGFKEVFNNTVYGYLFDYKMQLATQLLRDTNQSITEIAEQCGYDYASHFCTAFKRRFGVSPNEERKKFK